MNCATHFHSLIACAGVALALMAEPAVGQRLGKSAVPLNTNANNQPQSTIVSNQTFTVPSSVLAKNAVGNKHNHPGQMGRQTGASKIGVNSNLRMPEKKSQNLVTSKWIAADKRNRAEIMNKAGSGKKKGPRGHHVAQYDCETRNKGPRGPRCHPFEKPGPRLETMSGSAMDRLTGN